MHAEHVDLLHAPPIVHGHVPARQVGGSHPGIGDEELDRPELPFGRLHPAPDVARARDVSDQREPVDVGCDGVHLLCRPPVTATLMPASVSSRAIDAPIPRPPPVTSATPSS